MRAGVCAQRAGERPRLGRETYFVAPEMRSVLTGGVKAMLLVTAVDQRGTAAADKTLGTRVRARRPSLRKRNAPRSCPT